MNDNFLTIYTLVLSEKYRAYCTVRVGVSYEFLMETIEELLNKGALNVIETLYNNAR